MFFNNFINSIIKSMMALCVVANGWSGGVWSSMGNGMRDANPMDYSKNSKTPLKVVSGGSAGQNQGEQKKSPKSVFCTGSNELESSKRKSQSANSWQKVENGENNGSGTAPRDGALQEDRIKIGLIQFNKELEEFFKRIEQLSDTDKILLIMGKLDTVCNLFYPKQEFNKKFTNHKSQIDKIQRTISTQLNQITAGGGVLTDALTQRYVNIFPSLLRYVVSFDIDMKTYPNLLNAINNSYLEVQGASELVDNSDHDSDTSNAEAVNRLRYIVSVLSNY